MQHSRALTAVYESLTQRVINCICILIVSIKMQMMDEVQKTLKGVFRYVTYSMK